MDNADERSMSSTAGPAGRSVCQYLCLSFCSNASLTVGARCWHKLVRPKRPATGGDVDSPSVVGLLGAHMPKRGRERMLFAVAPVQVGPRARPSDGHLPHVRLNP